MGKAMAEGLAAHGARVVVSSRRIEQCEATAKEINDRFGDGSAVAIACNAGRKGELQALVEETRERLGLIDISIGNAGVNPFYGSMTDIPDEAFDKTLSTNVKAQPLAGTDGGSRHEGQGVWFDHDYFEHRSFSSLGHTRHLQCFQARRYRLGQKPRA